MGSGSERDISNISDPNRFQNQIREHMQKEERERVRAYETNRMWAEWRRIDCHRQGRLHAHINIQIYYVSIWYAINIAYTHDNDINNNTKHMWFHWLMRVKALAKIPSNFVFSILMIWCRFSLLLLLLLLTSSVLWISCSVMAMAHRFLLIIIMCARRTIFVKQPQRPIPLNFCGESAIHEYMFRILKFRSAELETTNIYIHNTYIRIYIFISAESAISTSSSAIWATRSKEPKNRHLLRFETPCGRF